jgi:hypothetical protein
MIANHAWELSNVHIDVMKLSVLIVLVAFGFILVWSNASPRERKYQEQHEKNTMAHSDFNEPYIASEKQGIFERTQRKAVPIEDVSEHTMQQSTRDLINKGHYMLRARGGNGGKWTLIN